jgi:hypothetical protein
MDHGRYPSLPRKQFGERVQRTEATRGHSTRRSEIQRLAPVVRSSGVKEGL